MDKGIRAEARRKFVELNARRQAGEYGTEQRVANTRFRKEVMSHLMDQFNITLASSATHYNEAFKHVKQQDPAAVAGLGRPEDKKGGRKPKPRPEVAPVATAEPTAAAETATTAEDAKPWQEWPKNTEAPIEAPKLCTVKRVSDDSVVATNLTNEQALELVDRAARAKKARLYVAD